jgi:peptidoglycan/LPS O-acetylase OafA/YrhL
MVWALERHTVAGQNFFINLKYFVTYTSNLFVPLETRTIFCFAWSLASEEQYYLIWPPLLVLMGTVRRAIGPLAVLAAACLITSFCGSRALSLIPLAMVAGTLLALIFHSDRGFKIAYTCLGNTWTPLALSLALGLSFTYLSTFEVLTEVLCAALVGACVIREDHILSRFLSLRALTYIGSISYGMYMLHMLCKSVSVKLLGLANLPTDSLLVFISTSCLAIVVASVSFYTYEAYFMSLKHRIGQAGGGTAKRLNWQPWSWGRQLDNPKRS